MQANNFTYTKEIFNYSEATSKLALQIMQKQEEDCRKVYNVDRDRFLSSVSSIVTTGESNPSRAALTPSAISPTSSESRVLNKIITTLLRLYSYTYFISVN